MKRLIAGAVVAGVAVFAGVGAFADETTRNESGDIIEGGGLGAFVIQVGDCVNVPDESLVASLEGTPCWEPHDAEAYYSFDITGHTAYPGESAITTAADTACAAQFHPYVGISLDQSELGFTWLAPTEEGWDEADDRGVTCLAMPWSGNKLESSVRGSGR